MTPYVAIAGTWGWKGGTPTPDSWWCADSAFSAFLLARGHAHLRPRAPFIWSTDLAGVPSWQFWKRPSCRDWEAAGYALGYYCDDLRVNLITHSHGLQVALWAAANGLKVGTLIDVCGPVREDMRSVAEQARPNIWHWLHIHSDRSDLTQIWGGLFDGHAGPVRAFDLAGVDNRAWPGVGHSRLLNDPTTFSVWDTEGWAEFLDLAC